MSKTAVCHAAVPRLAAGPVAWTPSTPHEATLADLVHSLVVEGTSIAQDLLVIAASQGRPPGGEWPQSAPYPGPPRAFHQGLFSPAFSLAECMWGSPPLRGACDHVPSGAPASPGNGLSQTPGCTATSCVQTARWWGPSTRLPAGPPTTEGTCPSVKAMTAVFPVLGGEVGCREESVRLLGTTLNVAIGGALSLLNLVLLSRLDGSSWLNSPEATPSPGIWK